MPYSIQVFRDGQEILSAPISELYARTLALLCMVIPHHLVDSPQDAPILLGRMVVTVEDALQTSPAAHKLWIDLYDLGHTIPVEVQIHGLSLDGADARDVNGGGCGGAGAWPGGGGGGGGNGKEIGGVGGAGADGAAAIFQLDKQGNVIDIEALVLPGSSDWVCQAGVDRVKVILIGGGGGGGSGGKTLQLDASRYRYRSPYIMT